MNLDLKYRTDFHYLQPKKIRQKLREIPESSILHVLGDDPESLHDIPVLLQRLGLEPAVISEVEYGWKFIICN